MTSPSRPGQSSVISGDGGQPAPKIEFPTDYSLKIVGDSDEGFCDDMLDIVERFDPTLDRSRASHQDSRNGRFRSLRVTITATGQAQLSALFSALKASGRVHMVI
ncbi:HP0495 family protein [Halotalea alkalilenta]|uniref:Uncharacterized protein n=1 Tax=Halotalea alkalilenta TaxID=376489 RepID=A0A172YF34_9GAMM|nr:DUF493 domain-containing protein [Halotalea alkalilenta]ANF57879.1 hypothetical protein A5892_10735 [Halotalea alkalilenta]